MCFLAINTSFLEKCQFRLLPIFKLDCFLIDLREFFTYSRHKSLIRLWIYDLQFFCSYSVGCLFTTLKHKTFLFLIIVNLFFSFVAHDSGATFKNPLPKLRTCRYTPVFSSKNFTVLTVTFRSLIHFELIFLCYEVCVRCLHVYAQLLQLCPTVCDPMDCSPPGSSVHEIPQARILKCTAISFSRGSS